MDNQGIVSESVLKEIIAAQVKIFLKTDEGKQHLCNKISESIKGFFDGERWWGNHVSSEVRSKLDHEIKKSLGIDKGDIAEEIIFYGIIESFKHRGYKVTIEKAKEEAKPKLPKPFFRPPAVSVTETDTWIYELVTKINDLISYLKEKAE